MKYARIAVDGATRWGIVRGHKLQLIDGSPYDGGQITETLHKLADVRLLAPVTPSKIFCLGRNYQDHRAEMGYEHDGAPSVFMKGSTTIIGQAITSCCLRSACPHTLSTRLSWRS